MSFFSRKKGSKSRGLESPAYDPYKQYQNTGNGIFGFRKDKHVVMPGVASYEENALFERNTIFLDCAGIFSCISPC